MDAFGQYKETSYQFPFNKLDRLTHLSTKSFPHILPPPSPIS